MKTQLQKVRIWILADHSDIHSPLSVGLLLVNHLLWAQLGSPTLNLIHAALTLFLAVCFWKKQTPRLGYILLFTLTCVSGFFTRGLVSGPFIYVIIATACIALGVPTRSLFRLLLFSAYFFAFFHKLNHDWFDPAVSCANEIYNSNELLMPFGQIAALRVATPWVALTTELFMSFGLLFRRTAPFAVVFAVLWHAFINVSAGFFLMPVQLILLAFAFLESHSIEKKLNRVLFTTSLLLLLPVVQNKFANALVPLLGVGVKIDFPDSLKIVTTTAFMLMVALVLFVHRSVIQNVDVFRISRLRGIETFIIIGVFVWGFEPYLGLSTRHSLTMHSNLRTELHSNHLLLSTLPKLFPYQDDLVTMSEYLETLKDCPDELKLRKPLINNIMQSGSIPYGPFSYIPRYQMESNLRRCQGFNTSLRAFLEFRGFDWPGPNQCRN